MMKKIFGMAAISALAFSMFACSGEDGADGISGKDGKDGADGIACTVKALKDSSGFKVVCDGDSVGVLKNGTDGKDGKAGKNGADGKDGEDGEDGADGTGKAGKDGAAGTDGTSCTAKAVTDGFKIICGKDTVGTLRNGENGDPGEDGEPGESCTLEDNGDASYTVTCGEKTTTLFKAMCKYLTTSLAVPYDPETQLCYYHTITVDGVSKNLNYALPKCSDHSIINSSYRRDRSDYVYNPNTYFCDDDVLYKFCQVKDEEGVISKVTFDSKTKYCDETNYKIADKVPCSKGDTEFFTKPTQYCYRTTKTPKTRMLYEDSAVCGLKKYSKVTHFCKNSEGSVLVEKSICAEDPSSVDPFNIDVRYTTEFSADDGTGYICDTRDFQVYTVLKNADGAAWMTQNLRYAYDKHPTYGFDASPTKAGLDSSTICYHNDCSAYGRSYLWSAAIDSAEFAKNEMYCGNGKDCRSYLKSHYNRGICPAGWHLPDNAEAYNYFYSANYNFPVGPDSYMTKPYVWTVTESEAEPTTQVVIQGSSVGNEAARMHGFKSNYYPVRCVKDPAGATTP